MSMIGSSFAVMVSHHTHGIYIAPLRII